jgi:hypothetical protein
MKKSQKLILLSETMALQVFTSKRHEGLFLDRYLDLVRRYPKHAILHRNF